ncbi:MAG: prepilin peptidase [Ruminococcus sp.]|uniref:prepilin peptidase n=1 Tax=Blautia wexlerae TaxID=418240 RepID=UPI00047C0805|nr:prepilin peptidase [Blautia wexlerae]MDU5439087.1 prepilin peptidase [Ruminococcus sp.]
MQYVFFHLFPVAVAGTAMIMDIRTAKVDNGWIIFSMSVGLFVCIWQKNITGIGFFIMGSVMPLFLMILFAFGMIGAGDIKLFCALGGIMGCESIIKCIFISFLTGAGISAALLIFNHNFCERILYFIEYVKCTVSTGKISSYRRKSIAAPENFHFTIPVFISVLLYAGGIY